MRFSKINLILFVFCVMCSLFSLGALNICKKCGYENGESVSVCTHCEAVIFIVPEKTDSEPNLDDADKAFHFSASVISEEVALGRTYTEKEQYELARLFYQNALAMNALGDTSDEGKSAKRLINLIKEVERAAMIVKRKCHRCGGTGKHRVKLDSMNSSKKSQFGSGGLSGTKCSKCEGVGTVSGGGTIEGLKFIKGQAESAYRKLQQARKYEPMGGAWIPLDAVSQLDVRQRATLMRGVPMTCRTCNGFGRVDCRSCDGAGWTECRNKDCNKGKVPLEKDDTRVRRLSGEILKKCRECNGRGGNPCDVCKEAGSVLCSRCDGSGAANECTKCGSRGYLECKKCGGTKEYRGDPCLSCRGEGVSLCSSCNGEGQKK